MEDSYQCRGDDNVKRDVIECENGLKITLMEPKKPKYSNWKDIPTRILTTMVCYNRTCPQCWVNGDKNVEIVTIMYSGEPVFACLRCDWTDLEINEDF